jgi:hypothetical protein
MKKKWELPAEVRRPKEEIDGFLARVRERMSPEDHATAVAHVDTTRRFLDVLMSRSQLQRMSFGPSTETTEAVLGPGAPSPEAPGEGSRPAEAKPHKGHGRHGVEDYPGATVVHVPHATLRRGDGCPSCHKGRLYDSGKPGIDYRFRGQPIVVLTIHKEETLRCNLCGELFRAEPPPEAGTERHDATVGSAIANLKYGAGVPFRRLETLQQSLGVPLPAANQWEIVKKTAEACTPVHEELEREAARGDLVQNDDTPMKILGRKKKGEPAVEAPSDDDGKKSGKAKKKRKSVVTTGLVSKVEGHTVVLYATGRRQAGENLAAILEKRPKDLGPPIQMSDGLDANIPKGFATIVSNCAVHARRHFVNVLDFFPEECRHVIEALAKVYHNDDLATGMTPAERLRFHQESSGPVMKSLKEWLEAGLREKKVEPNSRLGKAYSYMLKRWDRLTRFLEVAGTPLDNNLTERILKLAILHRKNALYYRTERGARVGDILMSLIQTARVNGENPFEYLTALQRHAARVRETPGDWLPWTYRATLAEIEARRAAGSGPASARGGAEKVALRSTG